MHCRPMNVQQTCQAGGRASGGRSVVCKRKQLVVHATATSRWPAAPYLVHMVPRLSPSTQAWVKAQSASTPAWGSSFSSTCGLGGVGWRAVGRQQAAAAASGGGERRRCAARQSRMPNCFPAHPAASCVGADVRSPALHALAQRIVRQERLLLVISQLCKPLTDLLVVGQRLGVQAAVAALLPLAAARGGLLRVPALTLLARHR